jgi:hypothetical protein
VPPQWIEDLGIHDATSGVAAARAARERVLEPARRVLGTSQDVTVRLVIFSGFVARAQCLHEAATQMIEAENPHAAFTLLRAYAENTAAILYAKDHPNRVDDFWNTQGHGVKIGAITNHAVTRLEGFKGIYGELSKFAHPQAEGLLASSSIGEDLKLSWRSAPHFKKPEDQITACAWEVELAEASRHLLYEFAQRYELGYFAQPSDDLDARDGQP